MSRPLRGGADGRMDALIAAAPADVAVHGRVDLLVGGRWRFRQQRRRLHDLAGLTIAALRNAQIAPGDLNRMFAFGIETFDGDDLFPRHIRHRDAAGADRLAVKMHGAGSAKRDAAAELRSSQAQLVAQVPHERHRRIAVERALLSVDSQADHTSLRWRVSPIADCRLSAPQRRLLGCRPWRAAISGDQGRICRFLVSRLRPLFLVLLLLVKRLSQAQANAHAMLASGLALTRPIRNYGCWIAAHWRNVGTRLS